MTFLVTVLVVIGDVLIKVLKGPPAVKVVPEVVKVLDVILGGVGVTKGGHRVVLGETSFGLEDLAPQLIEVAFLDLLLGRGLDISLLINGVVLATLDRVKQHIGGFLDTLEELVVLGAALGSLLIRMVLQHLLAVGLLDLVLTGLVAVLGQTENLVVVLGL